MNKKRVVRKRVKRKVTSHLGEGEILDRDQWTWEDVIGMDEVMSYVREVPKVNRGILLLNIGRHKGRVRVDRKHVFRRGDVVWVKYSGERDLFYLVGEYDKRGKRIRG